MTSPEINDEIILDIKVDKPKKIRAPHRYLPDGTYDKKPLSPTYFKDYWQKTKEPVECPHCKLIFSHKNGLYKHDRRSKRCQKLREIFATVAVFALIEAGNNVSAILANV
jgi:hypothetical protein